MAKKQVATVGKALTGKRVHLVGKFDWGVQDRLTAMAKLRGAQIAKALDAKMDILVVPDLSGSKRIQQKALSLNTKGAAIQVMDADDFATMARPTPEDILAMIRGGKKAKDLFYEVRGYPDQIARTKGQPEFTFTGENFDGLEICDFNLYGIKFEKCSFVGAKLTETMFDVAHECDFSKATGKNTEFREAVGSKFVSAAFDDFELDGLFDDADFTGARIKGGEFGTWNQPNRRSNKPHVLGGVTFKKAKLEKVTFDGVALDGPDFESAELGECVFKQVGFKNAIFRNANLRNASIFESKLPGVDFSGADLSGANLAGSDLSNAKVTGANLDGANLRAAILKGVDLTKAKGYERPKVGAVGAALKEMDKIVKKSRKVEVELYLDDGRKGAKAVIVGQKDDSWVNTGDLDVSLWTGAKQTFSQAMMRLANAAGHMPVRFESVTVKTSKCPLKPKEVRELAIKGIVEAFAQEAPAGDDFEAAQEKHREQMKKEKEKEKKEREKWRAKYEREEKAKKEKAIAKIAAKAGTVSDFDSFMKALEVRADKAKIDKATQMLKASGFELFNDVTDAFLNGVVKSQTDPDLVYACRIDHEGHFGCCTQNLNICGGLRGSICKHLLVLIIGLSKAGKLDPVAIDSWIAKTHGSKPELDKEAMGAIFIKYKGAEAGEVDWRPTETVPEDYYSL